MNIAIKQIYVRPQGEEFEVLRPGHRRGLTFPTEDAAVGHARAIAPLVLVLNRSGKVVREVRAEETLAALVAEYYEALAGDVRKDCDAHWAISERWSYGEHAGWFVEHDGYCYDGLEAVDGEDGPHGTRAAAERCMADHLRVAIAEARSRHGG
jgi:hypothetical protein